MRKNAHTHTLRNSAKTTNALDMGANITTEYTNVQYADNVGLFCSWTGAAPVGELFVDVSNDAAEPTTWSALDFGSQIGVTGNADTGLININQVPFSWLRVRYARTSGTGTLTLNLTMKQGG